jgi:hypothetical protein
VAVELRLEGKLGAWFASAEAACSAARRARARCTRSLTLKPLRRIALAVSVGSGMEGGVSMAVAAVGGGGVANGRSVRGSNTTRLAVRTTARCVWCCGGAVTSGWSRGE